MKWNQKVQFVIINVISDGVIKDGADEAKDISDLKEKLEVNNLHIEKITVSDFSKRVQDRLHINVKMDMSWYYKMCDYKPTLAHLFPELVSEEKYKYWGYADLDVIWGNFSRYAHWFTGDSHQPFVISGTSSRFM